MVQRDVDPLTGAARDAVLHQRADLARLGLRDGDTVRLRVAARVVRRDGCMAAPIKPGNLEVHWPEGNVLLSAPASIQNRMEPDYNAIVTVDSLAGRMSGSDFERSLSDRPGYSRRSRHVVASVIALASVLPGTALDGSPRARRRRRSTRRSRAFWPPRASTRRRPLPTAWSSPASRFDEAYARLKTGPDLLGRCADGRRASCRARPARASSPTARRARRPTTPRRRIRCACSCTAASGVPTRRRAATALARWPAPSRSTCCRRVGRSGVVGRRAVREPARHPRQRQAHLQRRREPRRAVRRVGRRHRCLLLRDARHDAVRQLPAAERRHPRCCATATAHRRRALPEQHGEQAVLHRQRRPGSAVSDDAASNRYIKQYRNGRAVRSKYLPQPDAGAQHGLVARA